MGLVIKYRIYIYNLIVIGVGEAGCVQRSLTIRIVKSSSLFLQKKNLKLRKNILYEYIFFLLIKEKVLESVLTCLDLVYLGLQTDTSCCE